MKTADDILMPHSPEVLAAMVQKMISVFESEFPGLLERTREWMQTEEFETSAICCIHHYRFEAPFFMLSRMSGGNYCSLVTDERLDIFNAMAAYLWKQAVKRIKAALI